MNKFLSSLKLLKVVFLLVFITFSINTIQAQFLTQYNDTIYDANHSSVQWGDYDNDGALDFLITGYSGGNISEVYKNFVKDATWRKGKFYRELAISDTLISVTDGSVAWGDYNNDGYLDILLTGNSDSGFVARIYKNLGNNSFKRQYKIYLEGITNSSVAWGDYNNDGFLDILLSGYSRKDSFVTKIYRNNGNNTFTEQTNISLTGVDFSSVAWGDYNNDGYLDILLTGWDGRNKKSISKIYKNNGQGNFVEQTNISLPGIQYGSVAWADYDNDGYLDILLTGYSAPDIISKVYKNDRNGNFIEQTGISLQGVAHGSAAWGDYNNDGNTDILLTGLSPIGGSGKPLTVFYKNNGDGTFTKADTLLGVRYGSAIWGDYNNDGLLDILLTGYVNLDTTTYGKILKNTGSFPVNTAPFAPTNLSASVNLDKATLTWDKTSDNQTPQNGLNYNVRIGTKPGGIDILSPMASVDNGFRNLAVNGPINSNSYSINSLSAGKYYWSVQAIDNAFAGGTWAPEDSFIISAIQASAITYTSFSISKDTIKWKRGNESSCIVIMAEGVRKDSLYYPNDLSTYTANPVFKLGSQIDTSGWYCIYNGSGSSVTVDGLKDGIQYTVLVLEYSGNAGSEKYNKSRGSGNVAIIHTVNVLKEQANISLTGVKFGSAEFGDYNNDGYLDILITGMASNATNIAYTYKNNGNGTFTIDTSNVKLKGVSYSSVAWGDYNNDGFLDILLTGWIGSSAVSKVYKNNGDGTFSEQKNISLAPVYRGSVKWCDLNNDGFLDILLTGWNGKSAISKVYKNNDDGTFTEQTGIVLDGVQYGSISVADYNNDSYTDVLITGLDSSSNAISKIYKNNGNWSFTEQTNLGLTGFSHSSAAWSDYDNDGYLDILLTGVTGDNIESKIYKNNGNGTFSEQTNVSLPGILNGSTLFADLNNDGYSDIILTGSGFSRIFQNNSGNGTFTELSGSVDSIAQVFNSASALGDFDNDKKLDMLLTGDAINNSISRIYKNYGAFSLNALMVPSNLSATPSEKSTILQWDRITDSYLPANSFSYNLRIGTKSNGADIVNPEASFDKGFRRIVAMGNAGINNNFVINNLADGTYYWSVQAIDGALNGGGWAVEQSFTVGAVNVPEEKDNKIVIYPNPANQYFKISRGKEEPAKLFLTDLNGKVILSQQILNTEDQINISQVKPGIYFIKLQTKSHSNIFKLIVE